MSEASIPVDVFNPGQVFACLGFMEAAQMLLGDVEAGFDWSVSQGCVFRLRCVSNTNPFVEVLRFLDDATVTALSPQSSENETSTWQIPTERIVPEHAFSCLDPESPATLPILVRNAAFPSTTLLVDHWADSTNRDNAKFWAGGGGYPGAALMRDALALIPHGASLLESVGDPFSASAVQSSSFRFDWRRDYVPIDIGFSLNSHERLAMVGFPLVEILAAIGLSNARPRRGANKLSYRYGIVGGTSDGLVTPSIVRAALGASPLPFPQRTFSIQLGWPGKEGQARAIQNVNEEIPR